MLEEMQQLTLLHQPQAEAEASRAELLALKEDLLDAQVLAGSTARVLDEGAVGGA